MHIDILYRLCDAVRRKRPEKWRTISWFLLHNNAPGHRSVLFKDFLAKNTMTTLEHLPYSSDPSQTYFYLWRKCSLMIVLFSYFSGRTVIPGTFRSFHAFSISFYSRILHFLLHSVHATGIAICASQVLYSLLATNIFCEILCMSSTWLENTYCAYREPLFNRNLRK
jgi:hypothetical protein